METINLICFKCKHWDITGCLAFPDGIPNEILYNNKHDKPLPEQKNNKIFEPKTETDETNRSTK